MIPKQVPKSTAWLIIALLFLAPLIFTGAVTSVDLTRQVFGTLPHGNGGTDSQYFGVTGPSAARTYTFPDSNQTMEWQANKDIASGYAGLTAGTLLKCTEAFALTGDTTMTSGACATVVAKINGTSLPTNSAADQALITNASATGTWASLGSCSGSTNALTYNTSTHAFGCNTGFGSIPNFADNETPSGTLPTAVFTLAHTPSPATSLTCFDNGVEQRAGGADFTLATATITFGVSQPVGTTLVCNYRY